MSLRRYNTHKKAKETINDIYDNNENCLLIHYSCESFYDIKEGKTPRITSIAVRYLHTAQTKSFSIHKIAETKKIPLNNIADNFDTLEKEMLKEFFDFVKVHKDFKYIHWNMRDINYGFEALQHRANVLGVKNITEISDNNKFDLARLLIDKYGKGYASHPRLSSIIQMNNISTNNWLNGKDEADAFDNKEFVKLHQSTLAKVDIFENILKLVAEEKFINKSSWQEIHGLSVQGVHDILRNNWLVGIILFLVSTFVVIIIQALLKKIFPSFQF